MDFDPPLQLLLGLLVGRMRFFLGEIPCLNKFRGLDALLVTADAFESKLWGKRQGVVLNSLAPMVIDSISPSPADLVVEDLAPDALLDQARVEIRREKSGRAGAAVESRGWLLGQPRRAYGSTPTIGVPGADAEADVRMTGGAEVPALDHPDTRVMAGLKVVAEFATEVHFAKFNLHLVSRPNWSGRPRGLTSTYTPLIFCNGRRAFLNRAGPTGS